MRAPIQHISLSCSAFRSIGADEAARTLGDLLEEISSHVRRVEIVAADDRCTCVLLSKAELDSLERALAILSGTKGAEEMREQLNAIAMEATASVPAGVQAI